MDMDNKQVELKKITTFLDKWKLPILLAIIGLGILLLSEKKEVKPMQQENSGSYTVTEEKIEEILSKVDGAGDVCVMLTLKNDGQTEYQTDKEVFSDEAREEQRTKTVFHADEALIRCRGLPEYLGAVVVCQGGNKPEVCLKLVEALCSLTGLSSNKITVLKMN